ncbi:hypothetical protein N7G274_009506 [Stereocaulon virgatum]|uniref:Uncharacterized protein n=1 Tax=Stereocaulon virgatum TaxID=373712 RepID=A0ABR3ZXU1_9LECA
MGCTTIIQVLCREDTMLDTLTPMRDYRPLQSREDNFLISSSGKPRSIGVWLFQLALILAIVAAAVGGSMAVRRQHQTTSTATQTSSNPSFGPTSDCSTLSNPYTVLGN